MSKKVRILCYGDSLTAGFYFGGRYFEPYGESLVNALGEDDFEVDYCGRCGATTQDMLNDLDKDITDKHRPSWKGMGLRKMLKYNGSYDLVILLLGSNDLYFGIHQDITCNNLKNLHGIILASSPNITSIALAIPDAEFMLQSDDLHTRWMAINEFLQKESEVNERMKYISFPFGLKDSNLYDDGTHFSIKGNQELGIRLARIIKEKKLFGGKNATDLVISEGH